jgi:hypothetical protein
MLQKLLIHVSIADFPSNVLIRCLSNANQISLFHFTWRKTCTCSHSLISIKKSITRSSLMTWMLRVACLIDTHWDSAITCVALDKLSGIAQGSSAWYSCLYVRVHTLTAVKMKITLVWDLTPCSLVKVYRRFRGKRYLHLQGWRVIHVYAFYL